MSDLPGGWDVAPLADLVDILDSQRVPVNKAERASRVGDVPYFGATGQAGWIDKSIFDEELVLLGEDGAPFFDSSKPKAYLINGPAWVNNHAHVLRARSGATSNKFLKYALDQIPYEGYVNGTTRLKLTQASMRELPIPVPPAREQERIVAAIEEHLSRLDAALASIRSAEARADVLRAAAIREAFASRDWPWTTLGEIAELKGGVTKDSKRQGDPSFVEAPYLRVANVQRGYLDLGEITTIRVAPDKAKMLELQPGDVLFNEGGDRDKLGRGWVWEGQVPNCIHQNHVFRARIVGDNFDPRFVSTHGNTWGKRWFETHGRQTTNLASINLGTLKRFPVPAPPIAEQKELMDQLDYLAGKMGAVEFAIGTTQRRSASLRRAVLNAAFSGRLVPQDPSDEPASALLDRLRAERQAQSGSSRSRRVSA